MNTFRPFKPVLRRVPSPVQDFRPSVSSGLIVPDDVSRERQVWTRDEWRLLERTTAMLHGHGVTLLLQCQREECQEVPLEPMRLRDGSFRLRCAHMDREMVKAF